jgi:hypothetical protein
MRLEALGSQLDPGRRGTLTAGDRPQATPGIAPQTYAGTDQGTERLEECVEPV